MSESVPLLSLPYVQLPHGSQIRQMSSEDATLHLNYFLKFGTSRFTDLYSLLNTSFCFTWLGSETFVLLCQSSDYSILNRVTWNLVPGSKPQKNARRSRKQVRREAGHCPYPLPH